MCWKHCTESVKGLKSLLNFLKVPRQLEEQFVFSVFVLLPLHHPGRSRTKPCSDGELLWLNCAALWVSGGFQRGGGGFWGCWGGCGHAGTASLRAGLLCKLAAERCVALAWDDALKSCAAFVDKHEDIRFQLHIL